MRRRKITCAVPDCGTVFTSRYPTARFCSPRCRGNRGQKPAVVVLCRECGSEILTRRADRKYCAEACRIKAYRKTVRRRRTREKLAAPGGRQRRFAVRCRDCKSVLEPDEKGICTACAEVDATLSA